MLELTVRHHLITRTVPASPIQLRISLFPVSDSRRLVRGRVREERRQDLLKPSQYFEDYQRVPRGVRTRSQRILDNQR